MNNIINGDDIIMDTTGIDLDDCITLDVNAIDINSVYDTNVCGDLTLVADGISDISWKYADSEIKIGMDDESKHKIYIVEPWQSKNPIHVDEGLCVSLESDLIPTDEIKRKILDKLEETNPEIVIKMGMNPDNMTLTKSEVNIEINKIIKLII